MSRPPDTPRPTVIDCRAPFLSSPFLRGGTSDGAPDWRRTTGRRCPIDGQDWSLSTEPRARRKRSIHGQVRGVLPTVGLSRLASVVRVMAVPPRACRGSCSTPSVSPFNRARRRGSPRRQTSECPHLRGLYGGINIGTRISTTRRISVACYTVGVQRPGRAPKPEQPPRSKRERAGLPDAHRWIWRRRTMR